MTVIPYISVPIAAVCCYSFLTIALLGAKKNRTIHAFIGLLLCFILWTGGSMLMRLQVYPGYKFWYEISILALFAAPFFVYSFLCSFVGIKGTFLRNVWFLCTIIMLVLTYLDVFLEKPVLSKLENGRTIFIYHMQWQIFIPTLLIICILGSAVFSVISSIQKDDAVVSSLMPIFIGLPFLVVGNVVSIVPNNIIPWDTLSGIINALLMFWALYKKRLFKLTLLVNQGVILIASMALLTILGAYLVSPGEMLLVKYFPFLDGYTTLVIAVIFSGMTMACYLLLRKILNNLFLREEIDRSQRLKDYGNNVSKLLNLDEILTKLVNEIVEVIGVPKAYVCLLDEAGASYKTVCTATPLDSKFFTIAVDNPCITWFKDKDETMVLKEFQRTTVYKSMWDAEKQLLRELQIGCITPLKCDNELVGIVLLSEKPRSVSFSYDDLTFLDSLQAIASIAIKNAKLYQQAYKEARTDHLTGLLNRKSFMEVLDREAKRCVDSSLALAILNLDDFKLYNQLYGNHEGDVALCNVARIISGYVGLNGTTARYSGKEFAVLMPGYNVRQTVELVSNIKKQIAEINVTTDGVALKPLTLSAGICVMPYAAQNAKQLLGNADMAVYNAKRSGKNKILTYSVDSAKGGMVTTAETNLPAGNYEEYASTIYALTAAIDAKDHYTFSHSQNVAEYATILATEMGLNSDHVRIIYEAALLHDIGKIAVPESILTKPSRLTQEEFELMKTHVEHSIAIIRHLPSLDYVIPAAIAHHERWDGHGYPRGIAGEDIPVGGRCLALADAFDAMTSTRSYKEAFSVEFACKEIEQQAGKQFDPRLADLFVKLVQKGKIKVILSEQKRAK